METKLRTIEVVDKANKAGARIGKCCEILGISKRTLERWRKDAREDGRKNNKPPVANRLSLAEINNVIRTACSKLYRDLSPWQIVCRLAEKGVYIASEATFYRILNAAGLLKHRSESKAPVREKPDELVAARPNQVWSWDISLLPTKVKGVYLYLYVIMDVWDRSIVGWKVHWDQTGHVATEVVRETIERHGVKKDELTIHQDNGSPMISIDFLSMLDGMKVSPSYSRPGVSDDNPYSESLFRTMKYRPVIPKRFDGLSHATEVFGEVVDWYMTEHRHSKIGFVTPMQRRTGEDVEILERRRETYRKAREKHPERWSKDVRKWDRPETVTLNPRRKKKELAKAA